MANFEDKIAAIRNRGTTTGGAGATLSASQNIGLETSNYEQRIQAIRNRGNEGTKPNIPDYSAEAKANFTPAADKAQADKETVWERLKGLVTPQNEMKEPAPLGTIGKTNDEDIDSYISDINKNATAATSDTREGVNDVNYGKLFVGTTRKGINQFAGALTSTADWLIGNPLKAAGWENNPVSALNQEMKDEAALLSSIYDENAAKSKPAQLFDKYGSAAVAAVPDALLAIASGGSTKAATLAPKASGLLNTIRTAAANMAKNPQYWFSVSRVAGNSYEQAKADGADDLHASAYAMTNGLVNGLIEVGGGGIQELPAELRSGDPSIIRAWVNTALDEGNEEIIQGVVERGLQNLMYGKDNKIASATDANAIINPKVMAEDAAGGLIVGGLLGGGQIALNSAIQNAQSKAATPATSEAQNLASDAMPANTAKNTNENKTPATPRPDMPRMEEGAKLEREEINAQTITTALTERGMPEAEAAAIAPTVARIVNGDIPTNSELSALPLKNQHLKAVVSQYTGATIDPQETSASTLKAQYKAAAEAAQENTAKTFGMGAAASAELATPFSEWRDNSTAPEHEMGENAVRYLGVPTKDLRGRSTMKTGQTIAEAAATTDENAALIENLYVNGDLSYIPAVNNELAKNAAANIEKNGWTETVKKWTADVRSGKATAELVATGAQLLNNAGQAGNASAEEYAELVIDFSNLLHNASQSLQAVRIMKMLTPEGRLYGMQKSVEKMAEELGGKYDLSIPKELFEEYRAAQTDAERDEVVSKIQKAVAKRLPSSLMDKWTALRYVNMLGNFKTQKRNILSNLGNLMLYRVKDEVGATIESLANLIKPGSVERTKSFAVSPEWRKATWADYKAVQSAALGEAKYNDGVAGDTFAKGVEQARTIFKNNGDWGLGENSPAIAKLGRKVTDALWKVPEAYRIATNAAMEYGDLFFSRSAYSHALAGFLNTRGVTAAQFESGAVDADLLDEARAYAIKQAQEVTLRDRNTFSDTIANALRGKNTNKAVKIVAEGALPFRRTPANAFVRMYEYSPLGLIEAARDSAAKKRGEDVKASDIVEQLSKSLTGTGLMMLGAILRDHGLIRASGAEDEEEIDAFLNKQDWSIVIPGVGSYTMDWASSAMLPLFMGAKLDELLEDKEITASELIRALEDLPEPVLEMSMLSGLNDAIEAAQYADNPLFSMLVGFALNYVTQGLTNSLIGQLERANEPNRMTTYADPDNPLPEWLQRTIGKQSAKVPLWDYQQQEYLDEFGKPESNGSAVWRYIENLFSPGYFEAEKNGEAVSFIEEVYKNTGKAAFPDTTAPKSINHEGEKFTLNRAEQRQYQRTQGEAAQDFIEAAAKNAEFKDLKKDEQAAVIDKLLSFASDIAKYEALENKGIETKQSAVNAVKAEMNAYDYIRYLVEEAGAETPGNYKTTPLWQKFEIAAASLPQTLAENMIVAQGGETGQKIIEAVNAGVSLDHAIAYYRATTERTAEGNTPTTADKRARVSSLGLTQKELTILTRVFK